VTSPPSKEWWVDYPEGHLKESDSVEHPNWIIDELNDYDAVILFFWQAGCGPSETQWEEMKSIELVKGSMEDGKLDQYKDVALLLSLDINIEDLYRAALHVYDPQGMNYGTPTTVVLTELANGDIGWYSYKGQMDVDDLKDYIRNAINYELSNSLILILVIADVALIVTLVVLFINQLKKKEGSS
jgi:hypothetical protein